MPIAPGEHADLLRAIGRLLDTEGAEEVQLVNNDAFLTLSWQSRGGGVGERHYQDENLEELRKAARDSRGGMFKETRGGLADMLRTLGQDLDREQVDFAQIVQESDGLMVSGSMDGRYMRRKYTTTELLSSSQRRRSWRSGAASTGEEQVQPDPPSQTFRLERSAPTNDEDGPLARRLKK